MRRHRWPADPPPDALAGRTALVTGASSGIGRAAAAGLARLGATVHLLVRDLARGAAARDAVAGEAPGARLELERCDVSDLDDVRRFAADFAGRVPALGVLVHNAGLLPAARETSAQGHEIALATHVLGPHLLTGLLAPALAGGGGRVIWVSSGGMYAQRLRVEDLESEQGDYDGAAAYARTKRMQVVLAGEWAQRLDPDGVVVHAMHPGWADTPGLARSLPRFHRLLRPLLRTPEQGADTIVWLSAAPEPGRCTGRFWHDRATRTTHYVPWTRESSSERAALWAACERLTGRPS